MKQINMETQNLLTTKTMPTKSVNNHRASAHFTATTKPSEILFDGKPKNWPEFENHLINEAENPTTGWNQKLLNFQLMYTTTTPFNFLEGYFDIPETMIGALNDDLTRSKQEDLMKLASQLYTLHSKNSGSCSRHRNIHANRHQKQIWTRFFVNIVSHTFPDK
jgi:hypothetical protein